MIALTNVLFFIVGLIFLILIIYIAYDAFHDFDKDEMPDPKKLFPDRYK